MKVLKNIGTVVAGAAGAASFLIALLHILGLLEIESFEKRIPYIILAMVGLALEGLVVLHIRLDGTSEKLTEHLELDSIGHVENLQSQIDPDLNRVVGNEIQHLVYQLKRVVTDKTFPLSNVEEFRGFYKTALEVFPDAEFVATSRPSREYFWRDDDLETSIQRFTRNGGKMKRIFFVNSEDEIRTAEVRRILARQLDIGVEVYIGVTSFIKPEWIRYFAVDYSRRRIAWELRLDPSIRAADLTADPDRMEEYAAIFDELLKLSCVRRYLGQTVFLDPHDTGVVRDLNAFRAFEKQGWETCWPKYEDYFPSLTGQTITALLDAAEVGSGSKLLDIACGAGHLLAAAHRRGARATGLDISPGMIDRARRAYRHPSLVVGDGEALPFRAGTFQAVVSNYGVCHMARPELCLEQARRVLADDGILAFTVWATPSEARGFDGIVDAIYVYGSPGRDIPAGPDFFQLSHEASAEKTLLDAGFELTGVIREPVIWRLPSANDFFEAFHMGSARIGGMLRAQPQDALNRIRAATLKSVAEFADDQGKLHVPMNSILYTARKAATGKTHGARV